MTYDYWHGCMWSVLEGLGNLVHILADQFEGRFLVEVFVADFVRIMDADHPPELCPTEDN
ncbi:hypothetical protein BpHYR1_033163 [Brachionus plicatilis]|uniref:Uncharacterized protein n=1 Tax=Brachionus plicatilis TaxID=10195 RepID=A0A3M7QM43_BRAPC|nr:hypothetical protein BpHYR1_033163 [Brachionus plicatilis]